MLETIKVQTTVKGYTAWVLQRLMDIKREPLSDVAAYVFTRWIDDNAEFLARYGLTAENFRNEEEARDKVTPLERRTPG